MKKKIALILISSNIPIPPKGWGAIEKYIWEYKINLEKLGHQVELRYPNANDLTSFDIVQVHTWNQALFLAKKNIPYIFSFDDTHAVYHGKNSELYKGNLEAIQKSLLTIVHGEYLLEYFNEPNMVYLRHGANPNTFYPNKDSDISHKLLCVGRTDQDDRKGLQLAIEAAKKLDLPITIVGPNEEFFQKNPPNYPKLTLKGNTDDEGLNELYNSHTIFLHPSKLETGHPNLTLIESLYCHTPIVGTCHTPLQGMELIELNKENLIKGINKVKNNYSFYTEECKQLRLSKTFDWYSIAQSLSNIYLSVNKNSMKDLLIKEYSNTKQLNIIPKEQPIFFNVNFSKGCKLSISNGGTESFNVRFFNHITNKLIYETTIQNNMWTKPNIKYYIKWRVEVWQFGRKIFEDTLNLKDKKVYISFESKAIGDTIAWFPYIEEFRKKHNCQVVCSTFHNDWFKLKYPNIKFVPPGSSINNLYASYPIGWYYEDNGFNSSHHPNDFKSQPLQKTASDILGLEFKELTPEIKELPPSSIKEKYVTISTQSTSQAKYWNHPTGWQQVIDYLHNKGYKVVVVDKHRHFGIENFMNSVPECDYHFHNKSLDEIMSIIKGAEFHIGIGSGLSWLAWALNTPVILISSFSKPWCEFQTNCIRIHNETPTSGYFNTHRMDASNWNWYPFQKIESMKDWHEIETITPDLVIEGIDRIL